MFALHRLTTVIVSALLLLGASALPAQPAAKAFDPEAAFWGDAALFVSVDVGALRAGVAETPLGAIAAHPGVRKALGKLPALLVETLRKEMAGPAKVLGMDPLAALSLIDGRVVLAVRLETFAGPPEAVLALELHGKDDTILPLVDSLVGFVTGASGVKPEARVVRGQKLKTWRQSETKAALSWGAAAGWLVASVSQNADALVERIEAGAATAETAGAAGIGATIRASTARDGLAGKPLLSVFVNVAALRQALERTFELIGPPAAEHRAGWAKVMGSLGLDKLSSVSYELTLDEGDFAGQLVAHSPGGLSGALLLLAETVGGPASLAALAKVPASAEGVALGSIHTGRLVRDLIVAVRASLPPDMGGVVDWFAKIFEESTGLSLEKDVYELPRLEVCSFQSSPPAGGLLPDYYAVLRLDAAQPYLAVLDKLSRKVGAEIRSLEIGGKRVAYWSVGSLLKGLGLGPDRLLQGLDWEVQRAVHMLDPAVTLAFVPLDDEWLLVAETPQAVERYLLVHAGQPMATGGAEIARQLAAVGGGSPPPAVALLRTSAGLLSGYASLANLAHILAPQLDALVAPYGVDLIQLPAGEEFLPLCRDGFLVFAARDDALVLRGHRVTSNMLGNALPLLARCLVPAALAATGNIERQGNR